MLNFIINITKIDVTFTFLKSYEIFIKNKYVTNFNHDAAETRYIKYENHMFLNLCDFISKIFYKEFKYINTFLNIVIK